MHKKYLLNFTILLLLFFSGCSTVSLETEVPSETPTETVTPIVYTETTQPTKTNTATLTPIIPTMFVDYENAEAFVEAQAQNNGGCYLPSIWCVDPASDYSVISYQFEQIRKIDEMTVSIETGRMKYAYFHMYYYGGLAENDFTDIYLTYQMSTEKIPVLNFRTSGMDRIWEKYGTASPVYELLEYYRINNILLTYGMPDEVYISLQLINQQGAGDYFFDLALLYEKQGFMVEYVGPTQKETDVWYLCPWGAELKLSSWDASKVTRFEDLFIPEDYSIPMLQGAIYQYEARPLEEATTMTMDEFFEEFTEGNVQRCIQVEPRKEVTG